jgi:ABC-type phosphate transport system substrate-binding protein
MSARPHPRRRACRTGLVALALGLAALAPRTASAQLAVVVNTSNRTDQLTTDELRRIFLAQSFTYPTGEHARVAMHGPSQATFAQKALAQRLERVRSRWMAAVFAGETSSAPSELASPDDVRKFVQQHPDAIAFLPVADVDASVKVLRVDGRRPGDAAYPIR